MGLLNRLFGKGEPKTGVTAESAKRTIRFFEEEYAILEHEEALIHRNLIAYSKLKGMDKAQALPILQGKLNQFDSVMTRIKKEVQSLESQFGQAEKYRAINGGQGQLYFKFEYERAKALYGDIVQAEELIRFLRDMLARDEEYERKTVTVIKKMEDNLKDAEKHISKAHKFCEGRATEQGWAYPNFYRP